MDKRVAYHRIPFPCRSNGGRLPDFRAHELSVGGSKRIKIQPKGARGDSTTSPTADYVLTRVSTVAPLMLLKTVVSGKVQPQQLITHYFTLARTTHLAMQ